MREKKAYSLCLLPSQMRGGSLYRNGWGKYQDGKREAEKYKKKEGEERNWGPTSLVFFKRDDMSWQITCLGKDFLRPIAAMLFPCFLLSEKKIKDPTRNPRRAKWGEISRETKQNKTKNFQPPPRFP